MRGLKKIASGGTYKYINRQTSRLHERIGLRADALKKVDKKDVYFFLHPSLTLGKGTIKKSGIF